jgi:hypothetical protein
MASADASESQISIRLPSSKSEYVTYLIFLFYRDVVRMQTKVAPVLAKILQAYHYSLNIAPQSKALI